MISAGIAEYRWLVWAADVKLSASGSDSLSKPHVTIAGSSDARAKTVWKPRQEPQIAKGSPARFDATAFWYRYCAVSKYGRFLQVASAR
jgi:hypothetical protein